MRARSKRSVSAGLACLLGGAAISLVYTPAALAQPVQRTDAQVHFVKQGEWLDSIAHQYHITPHALAQFNRLTPPYRLALGQKLLIPNAASASAPAAPPPSPAASSAPPRVAPPGTPAFPSVTMQGQPAQQTPTQQAPATAPPAAMPATGALKRQYKLSIGVRDGNRYVGDVQAVVKPDGTVDADSGQILGVLKTLLNDAAFAKMQQAIGGERSAPLTDFAKGGVTASFDSSSLQIVLVIPADSRPTESLAVADLDKSIIGSLAKPAHFSGYLNMRGSTDYVEKGGATGLQDPLLLLDGAVRLDNFVLDGEAQYEPGVQGTEALAREGTRIDYDDETNLMRWTAGDLQVQTDGFQGTPDIAGLSILRLYDQLAPQENVRPRGNRSFTLQRASTVQTFVNGQPVQTVRLQAGTYNLSNFPFVEGANNVHMVITDDAGTQQTLDFSIFFDRTLLKPGLTEFGAFAGVESALINSGISYPHPKPAFSGFFRHGFTDTLTAGGNVQADGDVQVVGSSALWGSPIGTIGVDFAGSNAKGLGSGYAINIGYQALYQEQGDFRSQTLTASFETRSKNFATLTQGLDIGTTPVSTTPGATPVAGSPALADSIANNPYKWQAALAYGRSFGQYTFAQLQASYAAGRGSETDVGNITATFGYGITENANVNFDVGYSTGGFQKGIDLGVQVTYRMGETANVRGEYDKFTNTERLSYENSQGRGDGAWSVSGSVDHAPGTVDFDGSANYSANRAELGLAQTSTYDLQGTHVNDERTSLQLGTSIAFADGAVALGRPIYDSFALFEPHATLNGAPVVVDPGPDGDLAHSDRLGPALLNDLGSYSLRTVTYDVPTAPAGYDIGTGSLRVMPPYHSGYKVVVGSDYSMIVIGKLLDASGAPVTLLAGKAIELDVQNGKTVELFTSRDGRFGAQGLRPGHWRIEMPTSPPTVYDIVIPKSGKSLERVGDLKPVSSGEKR